MEQIAVNKYLIHNTRKGYPKCYYHLLIYPDRYRQIRITYYSWYYKININKYE